MIFCTFIYYDFSYSKSRQIKIIEYFNCPNSTRKFKKIKNAWEFLFSSSRIFIDSTETTYLFPFSHTGIKWEFPKHNLYVLIPIRKILTFFSFSAIFIYILSFGIQMVIYQGRFVLLGVKTKFVINKLVISENN